MPRPTAKLDDQMDRIFLHPFFGLVILFAIMFMVFQAVFTGAAPLMDGIKAGFTLLSQYLESLMPAGLLRDFLSQAVIGGSGAVLVFIPQIVILFFFILVLEESGYLPRAAFLLDRIMRQSGLSGRSFIPLLSSFACAIPGIMATRTIHDFRDRLVTIMIAPLMTCSARLPVYALLIGAFIPERTVWGWVRVPRPGFVYSVSRRNIERLAGRQNYERPAQRSARTPLYDGNPGLSLAQCQEFAARPL